MNGSIEVLKTAGLLAQRTGKQIVSPKPTYDNLMVFAQYLGAEIRYIPLKKDMQIDLKAMLAAIDDQVGMVFLCNPGNPTGMHLSHDELLAFAEQVPKEVILFVDEAYAELADAPDFKSMTPWLEQFPNMIISRTMSKAYGLSGFRIGFALANEPMATQLNQLRTTYVTAIGVRAAIAAFEDTTWLEQATKATIAERRRVITFLRDRKIDVVDSQANCVWYKTGMEANAYKKKFEEAGIIVGRPFPPHFDWCRISIASPDHMTTFMNTYDRLFG
jgi:histidinol-phosphate aminotransferase